MRHLKYLYTILLALAALAMAPGLSNAGKYKGQSSPAFLGINKGSASEDTPNCRA